MFLTINFKGGLGNQLFQYSAARYAATSHKVHYLLFNIDEYCNESLDRKFALAHYNIEGRLVRTPRLKNIFKEKTKLNKLVLSLSLFRRITEKDFLAGEPSSTFRLFNSISGYWQSEQYFLPIRQQLLKELQPKLLPAFPQWIVKENTVAIHVRRTDYLKEPRYGFLGVGYYNAAIHFIKARLDAPLFIVFSDDMEWCKENLQETNMIYFSAEDWAADYLQLHLMSKCKHQIIANSSFSWWGAWLNENPGRIVIRPATPFKDKALQHESYYPETWITIEN